MTDVTRLLIAYNSASLMPWQAESDLPTLVVDNNSTDETRTAALAAGFETLTLPVNEGFGRAIMAGLAHIETPFALVLNPDARPEPGAVETLLDAATAFPECDLFLPALTDASGAAFFRHETVFERRVKDRRPPTGLTCIPTFSGAALFVRVAPFLAFGGFDPKIFLYFEDDDLALRYRTARRPAIHVPEARVRHLGDRSSEGDSQAHIVKDRSFGWSRAYVQHKHQAGSLWLTLTGMGTKWLIYAISLRHLRRQRQQGRIAGFWLFLRGRPAPYLPETQSNRGK